MSVEIYSLLQNFAAIILVAIVIKLMDDYLDQAIDKEVGVISFASTLREGIIPYTLLFFSLAVILSPSPSLALFFASYIIGMFGDFKRPLSFGLKGYHESLFILMVSFFAVGWKTTLWAIILIMSIQIIDDYIDLKHDSNRSSNNLVIKLGKVESALLLLLFLLVAFPLNLIPSVLVLITYPLVNYLFSLFAYRS